jgi:hypothetical protein
VDALASDSRHEKLNGWICKGFDLQVFSGELVNQKLAPKRRRSSAIRN